MVMFDKLFFVLIIRNKGFLKDCCYSFFRHKIDMLDEGVQEYEISDVKFSAFCLSLVVGPVVSCMGKGTSWIGTRGAGADVAAGKLDPEVSTDPPETLSGLI